MNLPSFHLGFLNSLPLPRSWKRRFFLWRLGRLLPLGERKEHITIWGKTRSGKTELLRSLALLTKWQRHWFFLPRASAVRRNVCLVILDPHGDFAQEFAQHSIFANDWNDHPKNPNLIYFDPLLGVRKGTEKRFPSLNPFDLCGKKYSGIRLEKKAQQLCQVFQTLVGGDAELSKNMEALLVPCLSVLFHRPQSTFFDLQRFLMREGNDDLIACGRKSKNRGHRNFFTNSFHDERHAGTKTALLTRLQSLLNHQVFAHVFAAEKSSMDLTKAVNSGKTIVINCSTGKVGHQVMKAMGNFFVGMLLSLAMSRSEAQAGLNPIFLIIDEMRNFVSPEMESILNDANKFGLHLTLAGQVVGQNMRKDLTDSVLGNAGIHMVGYSGAHSRAVMARELFLGTDDFADLAVGQFVVRVGKRHPFKLRISDAFVVPRTDPKTKRKRPLSHIPDAERRKAGLMTKSEWQKIKADQLERYYRPLPKRESFRNPFRDVEV